MPAFTNSTLLANDYHRAEFGQRVVSERFARLHHQLAFPPYAAIADARRQQLLVEANTTRLCSTTGHLPRIMCARAVVGHVVVRFGGWVGGTSQPATTDQPALI